MRIIYLIILIIPILSFSQQPTTLANRPLAVSGKFYPKDAKELKAMLKKAFEVESPKQAEQADIRGIIVPHAAYQFSGEVAAFAYKQLDPNKKWDRVFLIGSSHKEQFQAASVYHVGHYDAPFGQIKVDLELANELVEKYPFFTYEKGAHLGEHSLEMQLPIMQHYFKQDMKIVPIILGTNQSATCQNVAQVLRPYFNENNLFIFSTDFSHYPNYEQANEVDAETGHALTENSVTQFIRLITNQEDAKIDGFSTRACGWSSLLSMLYLMQPLKGIKVTGLEYRNSGDSPQGHKDRVVGYHAMLLTQNEKDERKPLASVAIPAKPTNAKPWFQISPKEQDLLLKIARLTLGHYLKTEEVAAFDQEKGFPKPFWQKSGVFVTLYKNERLRGCIGRYEGKHAMFQDVQIMAIGAATQDARFNPITTEELSQIKIEVSLLSPMKKISSLEEIELGRHGVYIEKDGKSGTFLPKVALQSGWTVEEFVSRCSRDKANLGWDGWKDADIYVYETVVFGE